MKRIVTLAAAAGIMLGTAAAQAGTVNTATQTITFGPGLTDYSNASQSLSLFDSSLGTLDSVTFSASYGFTSNLTITNSSSDVSSGSVNTRSAASFGSNVSSINAVIQNWLDEIGSITIGSKTINPAAFDVSGASASYSLGANQSMTATSDSTIRTIRPLVDSDAADLAAFEAAGGGLFNVLFNTVTGTLVSNTGGNTGATQVTTATGTLNIYYTYTPGDVPPPTPTPEPASMALLGTALLGLGMRRRSKR